MTHAKETRQTPALRLVGIDREYLVAQAAGVRDVILTAACGTAHPSIQQVERQRRMNADRRVQRGRRLPGPVTHRTDELADAARGPQRDPAAIAGYGIAV